MIVLGFDTATRATAIGLRREDGSTLQARDDPAPGEHPGHATRLLPLVAELLARSGLRFADLDRIAVGIGPGTFTGLRIGVATARGLAQSLSLELVGVSSLRALATAAADASDERGAAIGASAGSFAGAGVLAVLDARRGEVFAAAYANDEELAAPRALAPMDLGDIVKEAAGGVSVGRWIALGDGAVRYRAKLQTLGLDVAPEDSPLHQVSAAAICELGLTADAQGLESVLPDYRRRPDAEIALDRAALTGGTRT